MALVELVVALALVGGVLASAAGLFERGGALWTAATARLAAQARVRVAVDRIAADLRGAGSGLAQAAPAISSAAPTHLVLHRDVDGDGQALAVGETIVWSLDGGTLRRDAGGGAQPVADGIARLGFLYRDASGRATTVPALVRSVVVGVEAQPGLGGSAQGTVEIRLRNR